MKKAFIIALAMFLNQLGFGQNLYPEVIASSGGTVSNTPSHPRL